MNKIKLFARETTETEPRSIVAMDAKNETIFTVWADSKCSINGEDLYLEEVNQMKVIADNFYLFYDNIKTADNQYKGSNTPLINAGKAPFITGIILFIVISFCSCKEQTYQERMAGIYKAESEKHYPSNHDPDTSIRQRVWLYKGEYILQTVVKTQRQQNVGSKYTDVSFFMDGDSWVQYNREIAGTFDYIKNNKLIEYNKADSFIKDLRLKAARDSIAFKATLKGKMTDSAEVLNKLSITNKP